MDLVDIIAEKRFIGQEFLTWLWWKSETVGTIQTRIGPVAVEFGHKLALEDEQGKVTCSHPQEMPEAMAALAAGKKVEQARIKIIQGSGAEFSCTLAAALFEFKSVRLPKTAATETDDETEGMILERIYLFQALRDAIYALFEEFILVRTIESWRLEVDGMREWIAQSQEAHSLA